jgi:serine/threonine-protein kinase
LTPSSRVCPVCDRKIPIDVGACPYDGTPFDETRPRIDPLIGATAGDYRIEERIGVGGQGIVYRALQPVIGKRVALKVLRPEIAGDPDQARRLLDEAKAVNAVGSRAVIDVFGFGRLPDGRHYLVMELLGGSSLEAYLAKGRLPLSETLALLEEIAQALSIVHARAVVHRDLKPSNVFLVRDGAERFVKLLDFGLAKRVENADLTVKQTSDVQVVGTPAYIAPEQAQGQPVSAATDLYALGAMAFEMVTGSAVFSGPTSFHVISAHVSSPIPHAADRGAAVPASLDALLTRLLSKKPADRPVSATVVKQQLATIRAELASAPPMMPPALAAGAPRNRLPVILGAAAAAVAVAGVAAMLALRAQREPPVVVAPPPPAPVVVVPPAPTPVVAVPPVAAPVVDAPPEPQPPAPPPAPVTHTPVRVATIEELGARMDRMQEQLEKSDRTDRETGMALLRKYRLTTTHANSPAERASVARALDRIESIYFR